MVQVINTAYTSHSKTTTKTPSSVAGQGYSPISETSPLREYSASIEGDREEVRRAIADRASSSHRVKESARASGSEMERERGVSRLAEPHVEQAAQPEKKGFWSRCWSATRSVGNFVAEVTGVKAIYEGVEEGITKGTWDWKKIGIGVCQLTGTVLACMSGAGVGMLIAGAVLQNAGSIVEAIATGSPAAIIGAVVGVGLSLVMAKFGNVLMQKVMSKLAPVSEAVLSEGLTTVGRGIGDRVGADVIEKVGAEPLRSMAIEVGRKGATFVNGHIEEFVAPAIEAAKKTFGAGSAEVTKVASEKMSELSVRALEPELNALWTRLGISRAVEKSVAPLIEKATESGVLGQIGVGGGRVLSYFGLGNSSLRATLSELAPELSKREVSLVAKHLCRAVQQGGYDELIQSSLSKGITEGLRQKFKSVLEDPMKNAFMAGIKDSVGAFARRHGIEDAEREMMKGAEHGFDKVYHSTLHAHVTKGVQAALKRDVKLEANSHRGIAEASVERGEVSPTLLEGVDGRASRQIATLPVESGHGVYVSTTTTTQVVGGTVIIRHFREMHGRSGVERELIDEMTEVLATVGEAQRNVAERKPLKDHKPALSA